MNKKMNRLLWLTVIVIVVIGGYFGYQQIAGMALNDATAQSAVGEASKPEKKLLYWVAPMDPNYRRDKPGLSPMGMDLVPVYAEDDSDPAGGLVKISSNVENIIGVRSAKVEFGPLIEQIDTVGYIGFDQDRLWHVHPRVEGWIENLAVTAEGDRVTQGAVLFSIYAPSLVSAQEEFITALKRGDKGLITSSKQRLYVLGISERQIKQIEQQRVADHKVWVYAKFDGYVINLNIREGQYVRPMNQLLSIGAIDSVWVTTELFERQVAWLKLGLETTMQTGYDPGRKWHGKVTHIHPFLDPQNRTISVRFQFDNEDEVLKPNMFVQVTIFSESTKDVISIPREALIRTGKQDRVVLALGDGQFKSVAVVVGRESGRHIEIIKGLRADHRIVTSAHFLLDSESSVTADFSRMEPTDYQGMDHSMDHSGHDMPMDHSMDHSGHNMPKDASMDHSGHNMPKDASMDHSGHDMPKAAMDSGSGGKHPQDAPVEDQ